MPRILKTIDLFVGAGGLTQGFKDEGFECLYANDFDKAALETFSHNHPNVIISPDPIETITPSSVRKLLGIRKGDLDVLLGGPPCQGFSTYGKRDPKDHRNKLPQYFLDFLEDLRPKSFVIENVTGILTMEKGKVIETITKRAENLGYSINVVILDASEFGVPQFRKRVFILGSYGGPTIQTPTPTHTDKNLVNVWYAISDLPSESLPPRNTHMSLPYPGNAKTPYQLEMRKDSDTLTHHSAKQMLGIRRLRLALLRPGDYGTQIKQRILENGLPEELVDQLLGGKGLRKLDQCRTEDRLKELELKKVLLQGHVDIEEVLKSLDSGGFANKYRRLDWKTPSHTLVAHMARDCSDFVHPEIDRFITVREAARLQSFTDRYYFCGSQFSQFKQIGNAVPPKLGAGVARAIKEFLNN